MLKLANALKKSKSVVTSLNLSNNEIGDKGALELAKALRKHRQPLLLSQYFNPQKKNSLMSLRLQGILQFPSTALIC